MQATPLKNNFRQTSHSLALYSGCCCCCCCVLAPVGGIIAEGIMKVIYPERKYFWRHVFVSAGISIVCLLGVYFILRSENTLVFLWRIFPDFSSGWEKASIFVIGICLTMFGLFYAYSFSWIQKDAPVQRRLKAVAVETILTAVFFCIFFVISVPAVLWFMSH